MASRLYNLSRGYLHSACACCLATLHGWCLIEPYFWNNRSSSSSSRVAWKWRWLGVHVGTWYIGKNESESASLPQHRSLRDRANTTSWRIQARLQYGCDTNSMIGVLRVFGVASKCKLFQTGSGSVDPREVLNDTWIAAEPDENFHSTCVCPAHPLNLYAFFFIIILIDADRVNPKIFIREFEPSHLEKLE